MNPKSLIKILIMIFILTFFTLLHSIATTKPDTIHYTRDTSGINKLNDLAYQLNYTNPDKSFEYARKALEISDSLDYNQGIGRSFLNMAIVCQNTGRYKEGLYYCDTALYFYSKTNDSLKVAGVHNCRANIYYYQGHYNLAINWYKKALQVYEEEGLKKHAAILLNNVGLALSETGKYKHALDYYFRALKLHEQIKNQAGIAMTLANIGIVYFNLENFDKAMDFYERSLEIRLKIHDYFGIAACYHNMGNVYMEREEYEKALENFNKALRIFKEKKDINHEAGSYLVIGNYYLETGNYDKAIEQYRKALDIGRRIQSKNKIAFASLNIAKALHSQNNYREAYPYLLESKKCFTETGNMNMLSDVYRALSEYYENVHQYSKALVSFKQYSQLHDSLLEVKSSKRITEAELLYETEKKENEINILKNKKNYKNLKWKNK